MEALRLRKFFVLKYHTPKLRIGVFQQTTTLAKELSLGKLFRFFW